MQELAAPVITDDMIERACIGWDGPRWVPFARLLPVVADKQRKRMRRALEAALSRPVATYDAVKDA